MAIFFGTVSYPFFHALGSKKKLTLSLDSKKYLLSLCLLYPVYPSKMVMFYGEGSKLATNLSISFLASWHCCGEMKFFTMA